MNQRRTVAERYIHLRASGSSLYAKDPEAGGAEICLLSSITPFDYEEQDALVELLAMAPRMFLALDNLGALGTQFKVIGLKYRWGFISDWPRLAREVEAAMAEGYRLDDKSSSRETRVLRRYNTQPLSPLAGFQSALSAVRDV